MIEGLIKTRLQATSTYPDSVYLRTISDLWKKNLYPRNDQKCASLPVMRRVSGRSEATDDHLCRFHNHRLQILRSPTTTCVDYTTTYADFRCPRTCARFQMS
ncbi:hypothetical protein TNCV_5002811 [Trichonephila clavipes]|nr:hypothetical protein TNCV_5002811 [Trichonephila clavipes]